MCHNKTVFRLFSEESRRQAERHVGQSDADHVNATADDRQPEIMKCAPVEEPEIAVVCVSSADNTAAGVVNRLHWTRVRGPGRCRRRLRCCRSPPLVCCPTKLYIKDTKLNDKEGDFSPTSNRAISELQSVIVPASTRNTDDLAASADLYDDSTLVSVPSESLSDDDFSTQQSLPELSADDSIVSSQPISDPVTDAVLLDHPYAMDGLTRVTSHTLSHADLDDSIMRGVIARLTVIRREPPSSSMSCSSSAVNLQTAKPCNSTAKLGGVTVAASDGALSNQRSSNGLKTVPAESHSLDTTSVSKKSRSNSARDIVKDEHSPVTLASRCPSSSPRIQTCPTVETTHSPDVASMCSPAQAGSELIVRSVQPMTDAGLTVAPKTNYVTGNAEEPRCSSAVGNGCKVSASGSSPQLAAHLQARCDGDDAGQSQEDISSGRKFPFRVKVYCVRPNQSTSRTVDDCQSDNLMHSLKTLVHNFALGSSSDPVCGVLSADAVTSSACQRSQNAISQLSSTTSFVDIRPDTGSSEPQSAVLQNGTVSAVDNMDSCYSDNVSRVDF
jgi:hypothetical protein